MRNIHKFKNWDKASQENLKLNKKRTSIKRLYKLVDGAYNTQELFFINGTHTTQITANDDGSELIEYTDSDPNYEYSLTIPKNKYIKSGKYIIGYTTEYKDGEDDAYDEYYLMLGNNITENSHKHIPLIVKVFKEIFNFSDK